jgi:hypothetical protein
MIGMRVTVLMLVCMSLPAAAVAAGHEGAPPAVYPWPIGIGPRYHPSAANAAVAGGRPIGSLRCGTGARFPVHVELFARRRVVIVPPRIGVAHAGCSYATRTLLPTGVVEVQARGTWTLGDFFRVWGRRFGRSRMLSFKGPVTVFAHGRRVSGDARSLVLTPHAQIVIEVGGYVTPHASYLFPR